MISEELDDFDLETELYTDDYDEPEEWMRFYHDKHKLWEMRFDYKEDKTKSFEENFILCIKYNHKRSLIKKIVDIKTKYYYETGEIL